MKRPVLEKVQAQEARIVEELSRLRLYRKSRALSVMMHLTKTGVAVEKGTKAVISVNFSAYGERTFNNLRANFAGEIPREEFFNSHRRLHSLTPLEINSKICPCTKRVAVPEAQTNPSRSGCR